jgi:integrase
MKLTPKTIEHLKPRDHRVEIPDAGAAGLYLVLQSSGVRSWAVRYRHNGRSVKLTLAKWPAMTLADARKAAADAQHALAQGNNPAKAKQTAKIKAMEAEANTVASICAAYMKREAGKLRTSAQRESILRRLIYPRIGERPIGEIKRSEIVRLLDQIEDHNGPRAADTALALLRRVFHWHELRDDAFRSPIIRGMARQNAKDHRRTRILSDDEIRAVWQAASADTAGSFGAFIKLALLTSARRSEIAGMRWDEVGTVRCTQRQGEREVEVEVDGVWRLPPSRSKTKTEIVRPLSKAALAVLDGLPRIDGSPFAFTSATGRSPLSQFSGPKARLDKASGVTGYTIHDARRTARSLLARAGIDNNICERILGHAPPDLIARYDQFDYIEKMQHAAEALAAQIGRIVNPPAGEVIPMRRR